MGLIRPAEVNPEHLQSSVKQKGCIPVSSPATRNSGADRPPGTFRALSASNKLIETDGPVEGVMVVPVQGCFKDVST